jgi:hypothetical protein
MRLMRVRGSVRDCTSDPDGSRRRRKVVLLSASGVVRQDLDSDVLGCIAKGAAIDDIVEALKLAAETRC